MRFSFSRLYSYDNYGDLINTGRLRKLYKNIKTTKIENSKKEGINVYPVFNNIGVIYEC